MWSLSTSRNLTIGCFCLFSALNGFSWLMFDPAVSDVKSLFLIDDSQLRLLSSWQPAVYLVAVAPLTVLICSRNGIRRCLFAASACQVAGAFSKLLSSSIDAGNWVSFGMLHLGQMLSAVASPVAIGAPALLAAQWMAGPVEPDKSGAGVSGGGTVLITGLAVVSNNVGNGLAYAMVQPVSALWGYQINCIIELCFALGVFALVIATWLGARGPVSEEASDNLGVTRGNGAGNGWAVEEEEQRARPTTTCSILLTLLRDVFHVLRNRSAAMLCIVYSWSSGGYVAWMSMMDLLLPELDHFTDELVGMVMLWSTVAYVIGGLVSSAATQRFCPRHLRAVILGATILNAIASLAFAATSPTAFWSEALLQGGAVGTIGLASACGALSGAAAPLFYELAAEVTFPISEGVSGNAMSLMENIGALLMYQAVAQWAPRSWVNLIYFGGLLASCLIVGLGVDGDRYLRAYAIERGDIPAGDEVDEDETGELMPVAAATSSNGEGGKFTEESSGGAVVVDYAR